MRQGCRQRLVNLSGACLQKIYMPDLKGAGNLSVVMQRKIRLLIIDIPSAGRNLFDIIASMRKNNPPLKVIVASQDVSANERHEIYISGVIELIRKPVDRQQLLNVVRRIVEK